MAKPQSQASILAAREAGKRAPDISSFHSRNQVIPQRKEGDSDAG